MKILEILKLVRQLNKIKIVRLVREEDVEHCSRLCCYQAEKSLYEYYSGFNPSATIEEVFDLLRYSKELREIVKKALENRIFDIKSDEFDFAQNRDTTDILAELGDENGEFLLVQLYPSEFGRSLITMLSLKVESAYYEYLRREKGYRKPWSAFAADLHDANFAEPCFKEFKYWMGVLTIPQEVWHDKQVIGLLNDARERKAYRKQN